MSSTTGPQSFNFFGQSPSGQASPEAMAQAMQNQALQLQEYNNPTSSQPQPMRQSGSGGGGGLGGMGGISPQMLGKLMQSNGDPSGYGGDPLQLAPDGGPGSWMGSLGGMFGMGGGAGAPAADAGTAGAGAIGSLGADGAATDGAAAAGTDAAAGSGVMSGIGDSLMAILPYLASLMA